jgi:2-polyprenyl-3-methyl-5-hydroxy-6-metoxy-1,4-benzoquinol methylase
MIHKICTCNACNAIERLKLKVIAHSGTTVLYQLNGQKDFTGKHAIIIHRLLKNSVKAEEYILFTESAYLDLTVPEGIIQESSETYPDLGTIKTYVYLPPEPEPYVPDPDARIPSIFIDTLRSEVSKEYATVATKPEQGFHFHTGRRLAELLDYREDWLEGLPDYAINSFAGTGNPFTLGELEQGYRVLDVGCGAGMDAIIASRMVAPDGEVLGVDMTPQMIEKARRNAGKLGLDNVDFHWGYLEELPIEDNWADIILSNGSINLSPEKNIVFGELFRVLKPGGRIQVADILVEKPIPESAKQKIELWAG